MATNGPDCVISIPGYFYRDNCTLLCRPAAWTDVAVFFLGNYVAHIATVNAQPGQGTVLSLILSLTALLFPVSGFAPAFEAILSQAIFAPTDLQMAARAGALYMVVPPKPDADSFPPQVSESQTAGVRPSTPVKCCQAQGRQDIELGPVIESSQGKEAAHQDFTLGQDQAADSPQRETQSHDLLPRMGILHNVGV
jgi:hypothetical protein